MGIIKAAINAVGGALADSWLEAIQCPDMGPATVFAPGVMKSNNRSQNRKGNENVVSNGSKIYVYDNQFMILVDNGKIVDYTAEPGPYTVSNSSAPSLFNGQFGDSIKEAFERVKFAGIPSNEQRVFFINLQEIKNIKFGTQNPVQYFDSFYESELFMRLHGTYSIKVTDPFKFYQEVIPADAKTGSRTVEFAPPLTQQFNDEFIAELGTAFNQYSADGNRISFITSKTKEMGKYMADALDEDWNNLRGFQVVSVGMQNPSYDDASQKIIMARSEMASQVSYLKDGANQQAFMAKNIGEGIKAAGSNAGGAAIGFMGMNMAQTMGGNVMGNYATPQYQNQPGQQQAPQQVAPRQAAPAQQAPQQEGSWTCACGAVNTGKFCPECGSKKPEAPQKRFCTNCGAELGAAAKFCPECGTKA